MFYCSPFFLFLPLSLPPSFFFFVFLFLRPIPPPSIHPSLSLPLSLYLSPSSLTLTPNTQLDETKQYCSLTPVGCRRAMSSLLVELLFLRGEECHDATSDLPRLFQQHFGFPLPLAHLGVDSPVALLSLPEIKNCIQVLECHCTCMCSKLRKVVDSCFGPLGLVLYTIGKTEQLWYQKIKAIILLPTCIYMYMHIAQTQRIYTCDTWESMPKAVILGHNQTTHMPLHMFST